MRKSSSAVVLVFVSAVVLPLGCSRECKDKLPNGQPNPKCHGSAHGGGVHGLHVPAGGRSASGVSGSPRGGFGTSAGAHAGSGS